MRYEFKSWAEYKSFMSEHWKELKEDDEIVVAQPFWHKSDVAGTKLKVVANYGKYGIVTSDWPTPEETK